MIALPLLGLLLAGFSAGWAAASFYWSPEFQKRRYIDIWRRWRKGRNLLLLPFATLILCLCGCAFLHSKTTTNPKTGQVTTTVTAYSLFDSTGNLTKFQNRGVLTQSNEWAPGTTIGNLSQSATSTNLNDILAIVAAGVAKGTVQGLKP